MPKEKYTKDQLEAMLANASHAADFQPQNFDGIPQVAFAELAGRTLILMEAVERKSAFNPSRDVYIVRFVDVHSGEEGQTVIGGQVLVNVIEEWLATGPASPLAVTPRMEAGGKFGRYWVFD